MKLTGIFLLIMAIAFRSTGQNGNATLLVQSPDGRNVKLFWTFRHWSSDITGFDIKRKDGLMDWVKLNPEPILPSISAKKKISAVESDKVKESMIRARVLRLLNGHKIQETDHATFLAKLNSGDAAVHEIMDNNLHDYDVALISGFAFVDHSITKKTSYEYGLFVQGTDKLLATVSWNYGEIPDLSMVKEITSRATIKSSGIQVFWTADTAKMESGSVAGFNIYREGIRLNAAPIVCTISSEPSEFTWIDKTAVSKSATQYSISAESIFGIEGTIKSYTYNPADHPAEYKIAEVNLITSQGYYFSEGINVKWTFPKDYEKFIKGFYVEKNNLPNGYRRVSGLLEPGARSYTDKTPSPVTGYIKFRVVAAYTDRTEVPGAEKIYNYFPVQQPPQPQNLRIKTNLADKKIVVALAWDPLVLGDTVTDYNRVYVIDPGSSRLKLLSGKEMVRSNKFTYAIPAGPASVYRFCVSAISKNKTESPMSDTVMISVPSLELPLPVMGKAVVDHDKVSIDWQFPEVSDLAGFRLYQNNVQIAGENEIRKNMRNWSIAKPEPGASYEYTIRAVAVNGTISEYAAAVTLDLPPVPAKK